ncbi:MAG: GNAT family N-acetyltransferase [Gaiellaceae bacterium]
MSAAEIRPFRPEDAAGAAGAFRELLPHYLVNAELLVHWTSSVPERAQVRCWVAERDGEIVAWGEAELRWTRADSGLGSLWVGVTPPARGAGLGARLYELAESHLVAQGAWKLDSSYDEGDEAARRFAEKRGFVPTRTERLWTLDPREADLSELPELERRTRSAGFRLKTLGELLDRPADLHALYAEAHNDMPSDDDPADLRYDEWKEETLDNPLLDRDASIVVLADDRPVSFAWLLVEREGGRADHELTGTLREFRGRGLARLAKLAAIRWCRDHGVTTLLTSNDGANAAMLAINDRLGYRPTIIRIEVARVL